MKKKRGVGSAYRKRVARQGWWLPGQILASGGGPGTRAPSGRGRGVKGVGGCAQAARVGSGKERGGDGRAL
jgi:hypothetical protein